MQSAEKERPQTAEFLTFQSWKQRLLKQVPSEERELASCSLDRWAAHALALRREQLWLQSTTPLTEAQAQKLQEAEFAWAKGLPLAYFEGRCAFWSLTLRSGPGALVPRPDTELLVETVQRYAQPGEHCLEWGTGSGALALSLASLGLQLHILALERSPRALAWARTNLADYPHLTPWVRLAWGDWWKPPQSFTENKLWDWVIANPPYVEAAHHAHHPDLWHEPREALVAPQDGYADLFRLAQIARSTLKPRGRLLLEHGAAQQAILNQALEALGYVERVALQDAGGRPRALMARWPGKLRKEKAHVLTSSSLRKGG